MLHIELVWKRSHFYARPTLTHIGGLSLEFKVVYYFSLKSNIVDKVDNLCMLL